MAATPSHEDRRRSANELLCLSCQRGERVAWEELVSKWERPLFYYVRRMARSEEDALQILQNAWLEVFSCLPSLRDPTRLAPWLYRLTRRAVYRYIDELSEERGTLVDVGAQQDEQLDVADEVVEKAEVVHWGLGQLAPAQREALVLFYLKDLSLQEMAEVLGIPVGTVKSRLNKARGELRAALERKQKRDDTRA